MDTHANALDGKLPLSFVTGYLPLAGPRTSGSQSLASQSSHAPERQMPWGSSASAESSSWSHSSGNGSPLSSQYYHLLARFNELQRENTSLLEKNVALEAKVETLMMAYNMLLTHIPAAPISNRPALSQKDYPKVHFWTRQDWNMATQEQVLDVNVDEEEGGSPDPDEDDEAESKEPSPGPGCSRGKHRSSMGINVTMKYIELEDGTVVDGFRAADIRRFARSIWVQMALDGKLPRTWSDVDATSLANYTESMAHRFVELRLCAGDWKANLVATDNYPSWRHNWMKKKNKESNNTSKRSADSYPETTAKKSKTAVERLPITPEQQGGLLGTLAMPTPTINIIPGTPLKPQLAAEPSVLPQEGPKTLVSLSAPSQNLNFTIANPLTFNPNQPFVDFTFHRAGIPIPPPSPSSDGSMPAATHITSPPPPAKDTAKRSKGTRMRPTKTTTARNLCALEWVKDNTQGTTEEFKTYYNNLSDEQKRFWEDKSKAS